MWTVGISVSECEEAQRIGYDTRQINRIVIRMANFFLNQDMQVIFGHDWREDGVMRAIANFAESVTTRNEDDREAVLDKSKTTETETPKMLNLVPSDIDYISKAAIEAQKNSGGVLKVVSITDKSINPLVLPSLARRWCGDSGKIGGVAASLTILRHYLTEFLNPGCRICLGGRTVGYNGRVPGIQEEAEFALLYKKPLYLMGGFGGAAKLMGEQRDTGIDYWSQCNGLNKSEKKELFETTDIEYALRLILSGIQALA